MVTYTGINHLAMVTGNMDETIRFWRDLLGMRLVAGLGDSKYRHYFFEISEYDMIAFFEWQDVEKIPEKDHGVPVKGPFAFDHISLGVENDDDLWKLKDKFEAADSLKQPIFGYLKSSTTDSSTLSIPLIPTTFPSSSAHRCRMWILGNILK